MGPFLTCDTFFFHFNILTTDVNYQQTWINNLSLISDLFSQLNFVYNKLKFDNNHWTLVITTDKSNQQVISNYYNYLKLLKAAICLGTVSYSIVLGRDFFRCPWKSNQVDPTLENHRRSTLRSWKTLSSKNMNCFWLFTKILLTKIFGNKISRQGSFLYIFLNHIMQFLKLWEDSVDFLMCP